MADTPTTNYGLNVPTDGADDDVWGVLTNENWATLDAALKAIEDKADANAAALIAARLQIGDIWGTTRVGDPATLLGYGTWEAFAVDQTAVGAGGAYALGDTGGAATVALTEAQLASHDHTDSFTISTDNAPNHDHGVFSQSGNREGSTNTEYVNIEIQANIGGAIRTDAGGARSHSHTLNGKVNNAGSGQAHNNMQPYVAINYWKRTA